MTTELELVIANKNYSSWSLRAWSLMTELQIKFKERMLAFHSKEWDEQIEVLSPSGLVPVLWERSESKNIYTNDTLAITERLFELFPTRGVWPEDGLARARARSLYAEFHSGFASLRRTMPMNIGASLHGFGHTSDTVSEIKYLLSRWEETHSVFGCGEPFLFGNFCAVDACYLPVASRFKTYGLPLSGFSAEYVEALLDTNSMKDWTRGALLETAFVPEDEPYRSSPS